MSRESATICAIATPPGTAALGVIRVSGSRAFELVCPLLLDRSGAPLTPRAGTARRCRVTHAGQVYDEAVAIFFAAPRSYTGEDTVELCCHGGVFVLQSVLALLLEQGCALAEPGEFSKRAFLNGKMDLVKAQAVIDLIESAGEAERKNALAQMEGHLSRALTGLYDRLVALNAALMAYVDFPDEVEAPEADTCAELEALLAETNRLLAGSRGGALLKEGLQIAIVGAPNVGKSTLMNALLGYDRSIVSAQAGTTRDTVTEQVQLGGLKCRLADTAGLRETGDEIERQGVEITARQAAVATVLFVVLDGARPLSEEDRALIAQYGGGRNLAVVNKADLPQLIDKEYIQSNFKHIVYISAREKQGCAAIDDWIAAQFTPADVSVGGVLTSPAQIDRLARCKRSLEQALAGLRAGYPVDMAGTDITDAAAAVGAVTGRAVTDQMIDEIFSRFCVGK